MKQPQAKHPWDRRRDETPRAYALFVQYRDMGPTRSLRKLVAENDSGTKLTQIGTYSARHDWPGRAGVWDEQLERERAVEAIHYAREMAHQHIAVAKAALLKAGQRLQTIDSTKLTIREAVMLAEFAVKTERAARDEPAPSLVEPHHETERVSGADILHMLRVAPDLLDLAQAIEERIAGG